MKLNGGIVVANPIPVAAEILAAEIEPTIAVALAEAKAKNIIGKEVTPFLLKRLAEITGGRSLAANIALVNSNAELAAKIAVAYSQ
jgi:pseudouridylate synthase